MAGIKVIAERKNKIIYQDGDKCLKSFDKSFSKSDILNEALNIARIEETGIRIPALQEVTVIDGRWTLVYDFITGRTLAELMEEDPGKKQQYMEQFVDIQLDVQKHRCPMLGQWKTKMHRKIRQSPLDDMTSYELQVRLNALPVREAVCHGDFNPTNIIISEDGTPYIIDWSHVTQGSPAADAARTYLLFELQGDKETAKEYLKLYCKKSGIPRRDVQYCMPIVAASQLVKGREEEREFLTRWATVTEGWQ